MFLFSRVTGYADQVLTSKYAFSPYQPEEPFPPPSSSQSQPAPWTAEDLERENGRGGVLRYPSGYDMEDQLPYNGVYAMEGADDRLARINESFQGYEKAFSDEVDDTPTFQQMDGWMA